MTELIDLIYRRRSIRKFTEQPLSEEQIETLLKAGMAAPSAMNAQPWEFIVITDAQILSKFRNALMLPSRTTPRWSAFAAARGLRRTKPGRVFGRRIARLPPRISFWQRLRLDWARSGLACTRW